MKINYQSFQSFAINLLLMFLMDILMNHRRNKTSYTFSETRCFLISTSSKSYINGTLSNLNHKQEAFPIITSRYDSIQDLLGAPENAQSS